MQKVQVLIVDDLDGSEAHQVVAFGLDGTSYEIDLSNKHAEELRKALARYVEHARKSTAARSRPPRRGATGRRGRDGSEAAARQWAVENGYQVNPRGRVPNALRAQYAGTLAG